MRLDRTKNTVINFIWGLLNTLTAIICPFVIKTLIIYVLGVKYAGLHGLFSSILTVLSLTELGVGSVLSYSMYQPIADGNDRKICAILNAYKKSYAIIGLVVLAIGLILLPFIPYLINDDVPADVNVYVLYLIYLSESFFSYFILAYKSCLFNAFQEKYVISNIQTVVNLVMYAFQIGAIILFKNYYVYIIFKPLSIALINWVTALKANKNYPQYVCRGELTRSETSEIKRQVIGLLSQRLAFKSRNALDSIVISAFLGLTIVGIYNNYFYIITAVDTILSLIFQSMQSGIGNSVACETKEKNYSDFKKINFLYMWISGICTVCIFVLIQDFMKLWVGTDLLFPTYMAGLFAFFFWCTRITDIEGAYIASTGIWWSCKIIYLTETLTNLILNIVLCMLWKEAGVLIASIISVLCINYLGCGMMLYKNYFTDNSFFDLVKRDLKYMILTFLSGTLAYWIASFVNLGQSNSSLAISLAIKLIICITIPNIIFFVACKNDEVYVISKKWILIHLAKLKK